MVSGRWRTSLAGDVGGAYKELKAMVESELAEIEWSNGRKVFSANRAHPMASLLKKLVKQTKAEKCRYSEESEILDEEKTVRSEHTLRKIT